MRVLKEWAWLMALGLALVLYASAYVVVAAAVLAVPESGREIFLQGKGLEFVKTTCIIFGIGFAPIFLVGMIIKNSRKVR